MVRVLTPFEYFEPKTVEEASNLLRDYGEKVRVLAGGVDLLARIRRREIQVEGLVCIQRIPGLDYVRQDSGGLKIGALTTLRTLERSQEVRENYRLLFDAIHSIHSIQVKNMGTAVGNLCIATPASDVAVSLLALDAQMKIAGPSSERSMPLENFYLGVKRTALQPGELVTGILVPPLPKGSFGAFMKLVRTATDIAKVNVAVRATLRNGGCEEVRIALGYVAPTIVRARKAEEALRGTRLEREAVVEAAERAAEEVNPITDIRSTAEYRREMVKVLTRRAVEKIKVEAGVEG